jgi:hypothetical protein
MADNRSDNPEETFTFVDKRRTVDAPEETASNDTLEGEVGVGPNDLDESPDVPSTHSIYEVAAYCAGMLINEGFTRLGLIADPQTGKAAMDLPSARVAIDCVAALVQVLDEPSSTLPESMRREVKRTLNDLRLNYIDRMSA